MPILSNQRHELFAQGLAAGKTADQAYQDAGFKPNRGNSTTLKAKQNIQDRVAEIQSRAPIGLQITKQWVLERLVENANRAMQAEQALGSDGEVAGEFRYEGSVANRALELVGKELGMFIDRKEVGQPGEFDALDEGQVLERIQERLARIGSTDRSAGIAPGAEGPGDSSGRLN